MNYKLFLKETVVVYLRIVFKRCLRRVREVMKYLAQPRFKLDAANSEAWVTPLLHSVTNMHLRASFSLSIFI
jgi:hypothetical protein